MRKRESAQSKKTAEYLQKRIHRLSDKNARASLGANTPILQGINTSMGDVVGTVSGGVGINKGQVFNIPNIPPHRNISLEARAEAISYLSNVEGWSARLRLGDTTDSETLDLCEQLREIFTVAHWKVETVKNMGLSWKGVRLYSLDIPPVAAQNALSIIMRNIQETPFLGTNSMDAHNQLSIMLGPVR
jgi:hypothetical protein